MNLRYPFPIPKSGMLNPFEDWYVDLNLVNTKVAQSIKYMSEFTQNPTNLLFT